MRIRRATVEDCYELALLKRSVWETTYRGIYPNEKLDTFDVDTHANKFTALVKHQTQKLFVVFNDSKLIGYMSYGEILRPFAHFTHDIGLLYVLKSYQGKGIGKKLFTFAKDELQREGVNEFIISCNKYNTSAQHFYGKMGGIIINVDEDKEDLSIPQVKFYFGN